MKRKRVFTPSFWGCRVLRKLPDCGSSLTENLFVCEDGFKSSGGPILIETLPPVQTTFRTFVAVPQKRSHTTWRKKFRGWLAGISLQLPEESVSFLTSLCVHVLLILVLALISVSMSKGLRPILLLTPDANATVDLQREAAFDTSAVRNDSEQSESIDATAITLDLQLSKQVATLAELDAPTQTTDLEVKSWVPIESISAKSQSKTTAFNPNQNPLFASSSLEGRSTGNRRSLALRNGGSNESEAAVDAALVWFAAHQAVDGSWSTEMTDKPCNGQCRHGTVELGSPKRIAATGLALLCFLGAGHTHKEGDYRDVVYKAINYLTKSIKTSISNVRDFRPNGRFLDDSSQYEMYEHGIAVLAMCEAYEMTGDSILRVPCEAGIDFIQRSQHADGSWGYRPTTSGDLSIVGWQMMALKSAKKIGLKVRPEVIQRVDKFLDSQQSDGGSYYGYRSTQKEACTTSIGLLMRLYRGWSRTDPRILKGTQYISDLGPSIDGIYYNYYATQLLFHMKLEKWAEWNVTNRDYLVREQATQGHEKGSWFFGRSHFNQVGGRLYCTAMATLTLEVYYRFMPIYSDIEPDTFEL